MVCPRSYLGLDRWPLNRNSLQDALRMFFPAIKSDDPRLDFYTMYKREATEYDVDYVRKYDEDLNTTLIFVCHPPSPLVTYLTGCCRLVCSLPSVRHSSSISTRNLNPIQMINQQPSFEQSSLPSTSLPSQVKPPPFHLPRNTLPVRLSLSLGSCMQAF